MQKEKLDALPHDFNLLITANNNITLLEAYKVIEQLNCDGICINLNKPVHNLIQHLQKDKVPLHKIKFVDGISIKIKSAIKHEKVTYIPDAKNFSELGLEIEKVVREMPGKKFVLFDAVQDLFLLDGKLALNFIHFLNKRLKLYHANCIFLMNQQMIDEKSQREIKRICDQSILLD